MKKRYLGSIGPLKSNDCQNTSRSTIPGVSLKSQPSSLGLEALYRTLKELQQQGPESLAAANLVTLEILRIGEQ